MRILYLKGQYDPNRPEGSMVHITRVCEAWQQDGHEIWTLNPTPNPYARVLPSSKWHRLRIFRSLDVAYYRVDGRRLHRHAVITGWLRPIFRHIAMVWEMNATPDLPRLSGVDEARCQQAEAELREMAPQVQVAICNTASLAEYCRSIGVRHAVTVPLGSDPRHFRPDIPPLPNIRPPSVRLNVIWMGNSRCPWHDFHTLIETARMLEPHKDVHFWLIGDTTGFPPDLPLNITLAGLQPYDRMPSWLTGMDVGLCLYRRETWSRFGTFSSPLKMFDYMACGLAVVSNPIEQARRIHEDHHVPVLVSFEDPHGLAECLLELRDDPARRKRLGDKGVDLVRSYYNWSRVARETIEIIERHRRPMAP